jgi:broad specificity phosphatase PhoE
MPGQRLYLVRHGRPVVDPAVAAARWPLDPAGLAEIDALRQSGRIPRPARWYSSPEPKALDTARRLTASRITVVEDLREHERAVTPWFDDLAEWQSVVRRVFTEPDVPALSGWEPLTRTRARVVAAARRILAEHPADDVVLAGHGTAWTALKAELTGTAPDLVGWDALRMPDLWVVDL